MLYLEQDLTQVDLETKLTSQRVDLVIGQDRQGRCHAVWGGWCGG